MLVFILPGIVCIWSTKLEFLYIYMYNYLTNPLCLKVNLFPLFPHDR